MTVNHDKLISLCKITSASLITVCNKTIKRFNNVEKQVNKHFVANEQQLSPF